MALQNAFVNLATEPKQNDIIAALAATLTVALQGSPDVVKATATITAVGDTTVLTPPVGQKIRLYTVSYTHLTLPTICSV